MEKSFIKRRQPQGALFIIAVILISLSLTLSNSAAESAALAIPAFPGAEGFGASSIGGRGGRVIEVTNLNESGPGSLRAAIEAEGPRIVVFRIGGTIELASSLRIKNPFITIAGQTAPGDGITLKNGSSNKTALTIQTHDVIVRYIRARPGAGGEGDGINILNNSAYNVIVDHCSVSWAVDENMSTWYDPHDITIQWCIIAEGLHDSTHSKGPHSKGILLGSDGSRNISLHHNLFAHNDERSPRIKTAGLVDVVNNVIYNYGGAAGYITNDFADLPVNYIGNYVIQGPDSNTRRYEVEISPLSNHAISLYVEGNIGPHRSDDSLDQRLVVNPDDWQYLTSNRHAAPPITTIYAFDAYDQILASAGASFPTRDAVDERVVNDVINRTGSIINHPSEVGGWPSLKPGTAPLDSDHDGMPDTWETERGLNPQQDDSALDRDGDGYTNIEEYINGLVGTPPLPKSSFEDVPTDHWAFVYIELLYQLGYIAGCSADPPLYCPEATMTRAESAVFVERGIHNAYYIPPEPSEQVFADVPLWEWYAKWTDGLWRDGYTAGCGLDPLAYCPMREHTMAEGSVFFLRMMYGYDFSPPEPTGIFSDVPLDAWYAPWVEEAYRSQILIPCQEMPDLRACPEAPLNRAMGAYMMVQSKGLAVTQVSNTSE
ncbi:MAG: hypothetical protein GTO18_21215 [Anaerolineales bacterium]|nr:hypothetical protein [Anaerolineales bacterium]